MCIYAYICIYPFCLSLKGKKASVDFTKELPPIWLEWLQPAVLPLWYMKISHIFYLALEKRKSKLKEDNSSTSAQGSHVLLCIWDMKLRRILHSNVAHNWIRSVIIRSHRTAKPSQCFSAFAFPIRMGLGFLYLKWLPATQP